MKKVPLHPNPNVAEVLANNRDACRHPNMRTVTRLVGGTPGMIGGQRPVSTWYCPDCKQDVREWVPAVDDPMVVELLEKIAREPIPNGTPSCVLEPEPRERSRRG